MRIVITVAGSDRVGIVYDVASVCKDLGINIVDITQKVLNDTFSMVMLADAKDSTVQFSDIVDTFSKKGDELSLIIHTMREDIFNAMHRI